MTENARSLRRARTKRQQRLFGGAAAAVLIVGVGAVVALGGGEDPPVAVKRKPPPSTTTTTIPPANPDAGPFGIATTAVDRLSVYPEPATTAEPLAVLDRSTDYTLPTTLAVDPAAVPVEGWVPVVLPLEKPNSQLGWVQTSEVTLSQTTYLIKVSLSEHKVVLLNSGVEMLSAPVIIGAAESPTPVGRFFVMDPVNCNTAKVPGYPVAQCSGAYGAFAIGTSGLSEKLDSFQGTVPQIALHGTNLPDTELGKDLSNGCVRMQNDVVLTLAQTVPLGTPVIITA